MGYSPLEYKAIHHFALENNAVAQLSVRPMIRFKVRDTDEILDRHIIMLVSAYEHDHKEEAKERARLKRAESARGPEGPTSRLL